MTLWRRQIVKFLTPEFIISLLAPSQSSCLCRGTSLFHQSQHRIHVVRDYDSGDIKFVRDFTDEIVYENRSLRIQAGVGFITE